MLIPFANLDPFKNNPWVYLFRAVFSPFVPPPCPRCLVRWVFLPVSQLRQLPAFMHVRAAVNLLVAYHSHTELRPKVSHFSSFS